MTGRNRNWAQWRLELTWCGGYIELSFQDVILFGDADVTRWVAELELALASFPRPTDMLLDLRGLTIAESCAPYCCQQLGRLFDRHALGLAYYGASPATAALLAPCLGPRTDQSDRIRSRSPALAVLTQQRRLRQGHVAMAHVSSDFLAGGNGWDESGAAFI
ncbi:MAG: hypothetical protein KDK70_02430 [Myxococcales bacterium]|nr:hypothetical protein [Myxococcales bacterium]